MKLKIADNIRKYRKEAGLTQENLAERFGVSFQAVSRWENGTTYPDIELLPAIAEFFGVGIDELMGATKEERKKASDHYYLRLNRTVDPKERLALLHEIHREYPKDATIIWNLCNITEDLEEKRKLTDLLIEVCDDDTHIYVPQAIACLINAEQEDRLEALLKKHTVELELCREMRLEERYRYRKEWEKYELNKQNNLRKALLELVFPRLVKDYPEKIDAENSLFASQMRISVIDLLTEKTGMNPVSGDGIPDLWYPVRLQAGFRLSAQLAALGETEKALDVLEDLTSLYEKFWNLPDQTVLTYRSPVLDKIEARLHKCRMPSPIAAPNYNNNAKFNARTLHSITDGIVLHEAFWSVWDYSPLILRLGWEWFDSIRFHPRYLACIARMKYFETEEIFPL